MAKTSCSSRHASPRCPMSASRLPMSFAQPASTRYIHSGFVAQDQHRRPQRIRLFCSPPESVHSAAPAAKRQHVQIANRRQKPDARRHHKLSLVDDSLRARMDRPQNRIAFSEPSTHIKHRKRRAWCFSARCTVQTKTASVAKAQRKQRIYDNGSVLRLFDKRPCRINRRRPTTVMSAAEIPSRTGAAFWTAGVRRSAVVDEHAVEFLRASCTQTDRQPASM